MTQRFLIPPPGAIENPLPKEVLIEAAKLIGELLLATVNQPSKVEPTPRREADEQN